MPVKVKTAERIVDLYHLQGKYPNISQISRVAKVSRTQVYRVLRAAKLLKAAKKTNK